MACASAQSCHPLPVRHDLRPESLQASRISAHFITSATMSHDRRAFTLIEMLTVVAIIAVLAGLLLPAIGIVRSRAKLADARQMVREVTMALEAYRADDRRRRYPVEEDCAFCRDRESGGAHSLPESAERRLRTGIATGTTPHALQALIDLNLITLRAGALRDGFLVDPWGQTYAYALVRPAAAGDPTDTANQLAVDWNWDADRKRVRAWDDRRDRPGDFPYVWSYGPAGQGAAVRDWCYATP